MRRGEDNQGEMIGTIRAGLALFLMVVSGLLLAPIQYFAVRTGLISPTIIPRLWHTLVTWALGFRVTVHGEIAGQRPLMLASNHISWSDITILSSIASVCFISKSELARWPIFGTLGRLQRTIFVERDRKRTSGEQASELADRLVAGDVMVLFAEGSTSDGNLIMPFKSTLFGAAQMAVRSGAAAKVAIQPVAITYTRVHGMPMGRLHRRLAAWIGDMDLVPHLASVLREGAMDVDVRFGAPVEFDAASDRKVVTRQMEGAVRKMVAATLRDTRAPGKAS
jgi:1-acyl-sn-glycerol-3-phosphate acyltransferase